MILKQIVLDLLVQFAKKIPFFPTIFLKDLLTYSTKYRGISSFRTIKFKNDFIFASFFKKQRNILEVDHSKNQ